jgi:hypothetical protein
MRDYIEVRDSELKELREAIYSSNVYTIAIRSDKDNINMVLVPVDDYNKVVQLYNSLISDLKDRDLTRKYSSTISRMNRRFFR